MIKLDKHSSTPLYAQLREIILGRIREGVYKEGEKIPSELQFCDELELSRPTVRQAIAELVKDGILIIEKGKGTFIAPAPEKTILKDFSPLYFSFLNLKDLHNIEIESVEWIGPREKLNKAFALEVGSNHNGFWQVCWQEKSEIIPYVYCRSYVPLRFFPDLQKDLNEGKRMVDVTANKYAYLPQKGHMKIDVQPAEAHEASRLDVSKRSSLLVVKSQLISRSNAVTEYTKVFLRADLVELDIAR